jgi:radical SAM protein with 4Fe4S-binding SPASM domain
VEKGSRCDIPTCLNRLLFTAISTEGKVFQCQGIAARAFQELAYGDVTQKSFPEIWSDFTDSLSRGDADPVCQGCPHCAAAGEVLVNLALAEEVHERVANEK